MSCVMIKSSHSRQVSGSVRSLTAMSSQELKKFPPVRDLSLAFAVEADHNSIWPTHRIRSFLLSQPLRSSWREHQ